LAVKGGFEPPERLPVRQFSKLLVSATHPPHQIVLQQGWVDRQRECKYRAILILRFSNFVKIGLVARIAKTLIVGQ